MIAPNFSRPPAVSRGNMQDARVRLRLAPLAVAFVATLCGCGKPAEPNAAAPAAPAAALDLQGAWSGVMTTRDNDFWRVEHWACFNGCTDKTVAQIRALLDDPANEHIPVMGRCGPTLAWARRTLRALDTSLRELAWFLQRRAEYADVRALYGNMCLGTAAQCEQLSRIVRPYGFEVLSDRHSGRSGSFHGLGQNILTAMLVLVTNPATLRTALLRRYRELLILSRATLESHYGLCPTQWPASTLLSADSGSRHRQDAHRLCSTARRRPSRHH